MLIVGFGAVFLNYKIYERRSSSSTEVQDLRKENERLSQLLRSQQSQLTSIPQPSEQDNGRF